MRTICITGSNGLVGSACVEFFCKKDWDVYGIDNDIRGKLFGKEASTKEIGRYLEEIHGNFTLYNIDIRNRALLNNHLHDKKFDLIIHSAAQPSHEKANDDPLEDFDINVGGTINMLEMARKHSPKCVFIHLSTSKVYGDIVNEFDIKEFDNRYMSVDLIGEDLSIQKGTHCIFGINKAAADIIGQEYAKCYKMNVVILRPGCIIGKNQRGARAHGFLSYLCKCISKGKTYIINGYEGKQVRDQIHVNDLVDAMYEIYKKPKRGEVYNIGGGVNCNISILEAIEKFEELLGKKAKIRMGKAREADHKYNVHSIDKFRKDYPKWIPKYNIDDIFEELVKRYR